MATVPWHMMRISSEKPVSLGAIFAAATFVITSTIALPGVIIFSLPTPPTLEIQCGEKTFITSKYTMNHHGTAIYRGHELIAHFSPNVVCTASPVALK